MATLNSVIQQLRRLVRPETVKEDCDGRLLARFVRERDGQAFAALVERHGGMVLGVCRRVLGNDADADDAFQATFLTLAKKADVIDRQGSVGSWLYGVAYRVSLKARTMAGRRRQHERQASAMSSSTSTQAGWSDLVGVIDEEVNRLPEKFRAPLVLCYLEGKTREQAADALGCSCDTVKGRLERGRDALRDRLSRRGLGLPAAALAALIVEHAQAAVPVDLSSSTVNLVLGGGAKATVRALMEGVVRDMFLRKLMNLAATVSLTCVALIGAGLFAHGAFFAGAPLFVPAPELDAPKAVDLPVDKAVTHKLMQELKNTAGEAAVLANPPADLKVLAADFAATSLARQAIVLNDEKLHLLSAGPMLDSPDKVFIRKLTRRGDELQLDIDYTNVVLDGARLLQNYAWKPLVQAPVELMPGKYRLKVTWTKVRGELGDSYREAPPIQQVFAFVVVPAKTGVLPIDKSMLHRVSITSDDFKQLSEGVVVLKDAAADVPALARQYFGARNAKTEGPVQFNLGSKLTLAAVGPQLNSPDLVRVQRLTRHDNRLVLDVHYVQDVKNLLRNVPWRPVVTVPLDLLAGDYELVVNWQLYSDVDKALVPVAPLQHGSRFLIVTPGAKHKVADVTDPARLQQADAVLRVRFVKAGPLEKTGYDEVEIIQVLKSPADANFQPTMKIIYSQTGEGGGVPRGECTIYLHRLAKDGSEAWLLGNGAKQGVSHCN